MEEVHKVGQIRLSRTSAQKKRIDLRISTAKESLLGIILISQKIANTGFQLEHVNPECYNHQKIEKIDMGDISSEIEY